VCKVIDRILRSFLWHGTVGISKAAKVSWDVVYLPREDGGLGLASSSRKFMMQLLPDICRTLLLTYIPYYLGFQNSLLSLER